MQRSSTFTVAVAVLLALVMVEPVDAQNRSIEVRERRGYTNPILQKHL